MENPIFIWKILSQCSPNVHRKDRKCFLKLLSFLIISFFFFFFSRIYRQINLNCLFCFLFYIYTVTQPFNLILFVVKFYNLFLEKFIIFRFYFQFWINKKNVFIKRYWLLYKFSEIFIDLIFKIKLSFFLHIDLYIIWNIIVNKRMLNSQNIKCSIL